MVIFYQAKAGILKAFLVHSPGAFKEGTGIA